MTRRVKRLAAARPVGVAFGDLTAGSCRYPIGAEWGTAQRFCGNPVVAGRPYCARCCRIAYVPPKERSRTAGAASGAS